MGIAKVQQIYLIETNLLIQVKDKKSWKMSSAKMEMQMIESEIEKYEIGDNVQETSVGALSNASSATFALLFSLYTAS